MVTELSPEGVPIETEIWSKDVPHPDMYKTIITPGNRDAFMRALEAAEPTPALVELMQLQSKE